jgi:MYXO-CTERM domain-containing protein
LNGLTPVDPLQGCRGPKCWRDDATAYSLTEVAVNWNAPLVWVAAWAHELGTKPQTKHPGVDNQGTGVVAPSMDGGFVVVDAGVGSGGTGAGGRAGAGGRSGGGGNAGNGGITGGDLDGGAPDGSTGGARAAAAGDSGCGCRSATTTTAPEPEWLMPLAAVAALRAWKRRRRGE